MINLLVIASTYCTYHQFTCIITDWLYVSPGNLHNHQVTICIISLSVLSLSNYMHHQLTYAVIKYLYRWVNYLSGPQPVKLLSYIKRMLTWENMWNRPPRERKREWKKIDRALSQTKHLREVSNEAVQPDNGLISSSKLKCKEAASETVECLACTQSCLMH